MFDSGTQQASEVMRKEYSTTTYFNRFAESSIASIWNGGPDTEYETLIRASALEPWKHYLHVAIFAYGLR